MNIKRIYNNNVVMVEKDNGEEMIVLGKGLAFGKKVGETIEEEQIEKIFTLAEKSVGNRLAKLVSEIPAIYLTIAEEIVSMIREKSDLTLDDNIYITLTDHISMSLEREKNQIVLHNPMLMRSGSFIKRNLPLQGKLPKLFTGIWESTSRRMKWGSLRCTL